MNDKGYVFVGLLIVVAIMGIIGAAFGPIFGGVSTTAPTVSTTVDAAVLLCGSGGWTSIDKGSYSTIYTCVDGRQVKVDLRSVR